MWYDSNVEKAKLRQQQVRGCQGFESGRGRQGGGDRQSPEAAPGSETAPCDTTMVGACHRIFVQTHGMHSAKREPSRNLWASADNDVSGQVHL